MPKRRNKDKRTYSDTIANQTRTFNIRKILEYEKYKIALKIEPPYKITKSKANKYFTIMVLAVNRYIKEMKDNAYKNTKKYKTKDILLSQLIDINKLLIDNKSIVSALNYMSDEIYYEFEDIERNIRLIK